jgi:stress response protein SCP2
MGLPRNAATFVFTINSYRGHKFSDVRNAFCRVVDENTGKELARYNLSRGSGCTAMLMAKVERRSDGWHIRNDSRITYTYLVGWADEGGPTIDRLCTDLRWGS